MVSAKKHSGASAEAGDVDFRQVFEQLAQGVIVFDAQRRLLTWNAHYQDLMGFPEGALKVGERAEGLALLLARRGDYGDGSP